MAKINLTDEEKEQIINSINHDSEPSPDLMVKLFPRLAEKFDVAKLDRAKIATLEYAGKRSEASILNQTLISDGGSPLQVERCFIEGNLTNQTQLDLFEQSKNKDSDWRNMIVQGDSLQFLKTCYQNSDPLIKNIVMGKVKLIYIDPPFATKSEFRGSDDEKSYSDKVYTAEFVESLRERLIYMRELLSEDGNIYVHLDQKMGHYIKLIMDEIFGKQNYRNEVIWAYRTGGSSQKNWSQKHDSIFFYSKTNRYFFKTQKEKAYTKSKSRKAGIIDYGGGMAEFFEDENGVYNWVNARDVWDIPYINSQAAERTEYPTQKPEALIKRIISASSNEGDLVMDVFAGSGTTATVAEKLGRRWIVCDFGKHAIYTMQKRILRIAESKALVTDAEKGQKYEKPPRSFCVISCGAYDFSRIMNLRENKEAYINFVLGLFQLNREQKNLNGKYGSSPN